MKIKKYCNYATVLFDCDGVILDSNQLKTEAFFKVGLKYGSIAAETLVKYHQQHGGVSRYKKFDYFLRKVVQVTPTESLISPLLEDYQKLVFDALMKCPMSTATNIIARKGHDVCNLIVSGGDQAELREVFKQRRIDWLFDKGIYGSPDDKALIIEREISNGNIVLPAIFVGDSRYDHEIAEYFKLDFLFVYGWTDFADWEIYQKEKGFSYVKHLIDWFNF